MKILLIEGNGTLQLGIITFILGFLLSFLPLRYENLKTSLEKYFSDGNLEKNLKFLQSGFGYTQCE